MGISVCIILSECNRISSVSGHLLALYCLGAIYILSLEMSFGIILSEGSIISSVWGISFSIILSDGSIISSVWGIPFSVRLSEGSIISSVWGIQFSVILSVGSIISSVWGYILILLEKSPRKRGNIS